MSKFKYFFILFYILNSNALAQNISKKEVDDILFNKITLLNKNGKYQEAYKLGISAESISHNIGYLKGEAWSDYRIGNSLIDFEKYPEALKYLKKSFKLNEKLKDKQLEIGLKISFGRY